MYLNEVRSENSSTIHDLLVMGWLPEKMLKLRESTDLGVKSFNCEIEILSSSVQ